MTRKKSAASKRNADKNRKRIERSASITEGSESGGQEENDQVDRIRGRSSTRRKTSHPQPRPTPLAHQNLNLPPPLAVQNHNLQQPAISANTAAQRRSRQSLSPAAAEQIRQLNAQSKLESYQKSQKVFLLPYVPSSFSTCLKKWFASELLARISCHYPLLYSQYFYFFPIYEGEL